jgi:3-oxoacyl-(acyl-carrier-protein) synthase
MSRATSRPRVVVTGMGVLAPNATGVPAFEAALREGKSGISYQPKMAELGMSCQVAGVPAVDDDALAALLFPAQLRAMNQHLKYAALAAAECWRSAGFALIREQPSATDWSTGAVIGSGVSGVETLCETVGPLTDGKQVRRLGSRTVEQSMSSAAAACVSGLLGLGGPVIATAAACASGTAAILEAVWLIRSRRAARVLAGAAEASSHYTWAMFDAMRVLGRDFNDRPTEASRPLSASAGGFIPSAGAGMLMLEEREAALQRGAHVYAEILGGASNSGGQREDGTMTSSNSHGVVRCVRAALVDAGVAPGEVDSISGHMTATAGDVKEVRNIAAAFETPLRKLPMLNATKSLIGHALGAAGAIETIAAILQLDGGFLHPSLNCDDLHPDLRELEERIPRRPIPHDGRMTLKTSLGFGDVNTCLVLSTPNP